MKSPYCRRIVRNIKWLLLAQYYTIILTFHNLNGHGILDIIIFVVSSSCRHWLDMHTLPYLNAYSSGKFKWTVQNAIYLHVYCMLQTNVNILSIFIMLPMLNFNKKGKCLCRAMRICSKIPIETVCYTCMRTVGNSVYPSHTQLLHRANNEKNRVQSKNTSSTGCIGQFTPMW